MKPVFYPSSPDTPRLQFLKSFSSLEDFGAVSEYSGFDRFLFGEPEAEEGIKKPYGMAMFEGKLYVCDVGKNMVEVFDFVNRSFDYMTKDRRLINPINIAIDDKGEKYVTDPSAGAVFVFGRNNNLKAILGKELSIKPIDISIQGDRCYVTDGTSSQVVVLDKTTGSEVSRIGTKGSLESISMSDLPPGHLVLISDLALDQQGNVYVTDKAAARITKFDKGGIFQRTFGQWGSGIDDLVRPKGIAIDRENRIWMIDTAPDIAKIYNSEGRLLLFFGQTGNEPGKMNIPATIILDYDNVKYFQEYAVDGAEIKFLVLVSNQYGPNKISVYGFGNFPVRKKTKVTN
jgi:hypothetical protein